MKALIKLVCINLIFALQISAQNCPFEESVPDEMFRGRYIETGMTYGNPYTMFNRKREGWRLDSTLSEVKKNIINGIDKTTGQASNEYSIIYKAPTVRSLVRWAIA